MAEDRTLSAAERVAAVELAIEAIAERIDWKRPPARVTDQRLAVLLPPTAVDQLEQRRLRVQVRMYELLGYEERR